MLCHHFPLLDPPSRSMVSHKPGAGDETLTPEASVREAVKEKRRQPSPESPRCRCCVAHEGVWKGSLQAHSHACSACKNVFVKDSWKAEILHTHEREQRDLVCAGCRERGYMPGKYTEYQCQDCLEEFGCCRFEKHVMQNAKRQKQSRLVCRTCRAKAQQLRCSKCDKAYEDKAWTRIERQNHRGSRYRTKLVCSACRALGLHPSNLQDYTCHTCAK